MNEINMEISNNIEDCFAYSNEYILKLLKKEWGVGRNEELKLIGILRLFRDVNGNPYYMIMDVRKNGASSVLQYPLLNTSIMVQIVNQEKFLGQKPEDINNQLVSFVPKISNLQVRKKYNNPFMIMVDESNINFLTEIPVSILEAAISSHKDKGYIEQWVVDFYRLKNDGKLNDEYQLLKRELESEKKLEVDSLDSLKKIKEQESRRVDSLKKEKAVLMTDSLTLTENIRSKKEEVSDISRMIEVLDVEHQVQKETLEKSLMSLKDLIEKRTDSLLKLDLLTQAELNNLLGVANEDQKSQGHSFVDFFEGDFDKVIAYIQAYLYQKGIVYRRSVLADFLALLKSNDLIILAGDSGSGKTHLVKSFADAIGGKSVIIPVKPNWTSAEDLLGYYNPLENKYLSTPFLDAIIEASKNPQTPYLICLDEMNLARVEYYFADFLSLLEERTEVPEIPLYSDTESELLATEVKNFISLIDEAKLQTEQLDLMSFLDILKDEALNRKLHELCGFKEGDSLLKYHVRLRRMMSSYLGIPSKIKMPGNVRIIGAINIDETTHYLSPKILDRAHIMKFSSPLLMDWSEIEAEIEAFTYEVDQPVVFPIHILNNRTAYPNFDREDELVQILVRLVQEYLDPLGVEFGLRTIRQALNYRNLLQNFEGLTDGLILNQIVLHKILPKMMFDGNRSLLGVYSNEGVLRKDHLAKMLDHLNVLLEDTNFEGYNSCLVELRALIDNAVANDGVVNYWAR